MYIILYVLSTDLSKVADKAAPGLTGPGPWPVRVGPVCDQSASRPSRLLCPLDSARDQATGPALTGRAAGSRAEVPPGVITGVPLE